MSPIIDREAKRYNKKQPTAQELEQVRRFLLSNETLVPIEPFLQPAPHHHHTLNTTTLVHNRTLLLHHLQSQKSTFLATTQWSPSIYAYCQRCLVYMGDMCCRHGLSGVIPWTKLCAMGATPREATLAAYMYALQGSTSSSSSSWYYLQAVTWHNTLFSVNEKTAYLRMQALVQNGQIDTAEQILTTLSDDPTSEACTRLRTYLPLLDYYCNIQPNLTAVRRLYASMQQASGVYLEAETYCGLLRAGGRNGWFKNATTSHRPDLLTEWVQDLADSHLEINQACVQLLQEGFKDGVRFMGRVSVGNDTICTTTGSKLRLLVLSRDRRLEAQRELVRMAADMRDDFTYKLTHKYNKTLTDDMSGSQASRQLRHYMNWLRWRKGDAFTAFVDGPNVAYFGHGWVYWSQVQQVVEALEAMGENPLVIMPHKYMSASFRLSGSQSFQKLQEDDLAIIQSLNRTGKIYTVPPGCFDDFYWMVSSISPQGNATSFEDHQHIYPNNPQGRLPGMRPLLISNDQMRDHRWSMLEPRLFRRWTSCHIVNYSLDPDKGLSLTPAKTFSREIQGNPAPKMGNCTAWHFPVTEWDDPDRFCIVVDK